ncbi:MULTISPECIES: hypothetical protein [Arthrobacter]|uniref:Uncharacterized protein n=1 Tax=Arthrobacter terricola TaxID=2547396 RepID=A0A4R5KYR7_9MICC|nr:MULTISPECIES: hypothetical protein [Arthrobacter]MBT8159626.1 hypothetical protein [Arthrobacter sp. GN70]TDG01260.1 hypothetical protein E1809_01685 [Arthrobacter terricola]
MPRRPRNTAAGTPALGRAAAVVAAAAVLVSAPGIAQAMFTGTDTASLAASTMSLAAPTGTAVVAACPAGRILSIVVADHGTVPRATSYDFVLTDPTGANVPTSGWTYTAAHPALKGTWTYQIHGLYQAAPGNTWIGAPYTGTVTC